jgi:hypothetical protein
LDATQRRDLIERHRDGARAVSEAVASLSLVELDRRAGQQWSAREVVHHLADAEMIEGVRLRRILAEDEPLLPWADEAEYARRLHYQRPVEASLGVFKALVAANAELLEAIDEALWRRRGVHALRGAYSVEDWLTEMAEHAHDHTAQMLRAAGHDVI